MSERIEFIDFDIPVVIRQLNHVNHDIALCAHKEAVYLSDGRVIGLHDLTQESLDRIGAERKRTLARIEAQAVADKVDAYEPGCFAIDRDGRKWDYLGDSVWMHDSGRLWKGDLALLCPVFYLPRPIVKQVTVHGKTWTFSDGFWRDEAGRAWVGIWASALQLMWEQGQEIERLKAGAK